MSLATAPKLMTAEEFLALPDDGNDRDLIDGKVYVWGQRMTARNRHHSGVESQIVYLLKVWLRTRPDLGGRIVSGEAGFRLRETPDSLVGVDVAYAGAEVVRKTAPEEPYFAGPPVLAVEILSPSDRHDQVVLKVKKYLDVGTVVWLVDPDFRTVSVHRPGLPPESLNTSQELDGAPELPGLRVAVADIFA